MSIDLASFAKNNKVKYFMISFTDIFGAQRAKLVPTEAIKEMQNEGAGFAGFATYLDLTPAHPDMFAIPDASSAIQLPWKKDVAWVAVPSVVTSLSLIQGLTFVKLCTRRDAVFENLGYILVVGNVDGSGRCKVGSDL